MSCTSLIPRAQIPVSQSYCAPVISRPQASPPAEETQPTGNGFRRRLFLLLVMIWAIVFANSAIRTAHAEETGSRETKPTNETTTTKETHEVTTQSISPAVHRLPRKPAPELQVAEWVDQNGSIRPPQLRGKVQLVVFWGTTCPPCLQKIPKLRQVASRHAGKGLVVVGLHNANITPAQLKEFAHKRKLNYPLAIDRRAATRYSFGRTTDAFKVPSIPHAAVIDRDGSLKFVGAFDKALKTAEALTTVSSG